MKWEAFTIKTSHIYNDNKNKASFDSRIPWWDLAPDILLSPLPLYLYSFDFSPLLY